MPFRRHRRFFSEPVPARKNFIFQGIKADTSLVRPISTGPCGMPGGTK